MLVCSFFLISHVVNSFSGGLVSFKLFFDFLVCFCFCIFSSVNSICLYFKFTLSLVIIFAPDVLKLAFYFFKQSKCSCFIGSVQSNIYSLLRLTYFIFFPDLFLLILFHGLFSSLCLVILVYWSLYVKKLFVG